MEEINLQTIQAVRLKSDKNIRKKYLFKVFVVKKKNKLFWYKIGKNQWIMAIDTDKPFIKKI